jgi:HK97 family phage portal protein
MNLLQRVVNFFDKRSLTSSELFQLIAAGNTTYSGVSVTEDNAMRSSAVYACIRIISESIASLPLVLYRQSGRNKNRATDHPTYSVLHDLANPLMTALEWRELTMAHALLRGNSWSQKTLNFRGQTIELWPLNPAKMEGYDWRGGKLFWLYRNPDNELQALNSDIVHHVKGLGNGIWGNSPIMQSGKQAIGLSLAAEEYGARYYGNGARPGLILRHPGKLSPGAAERLKASFATEHQGLNNAHRTKILEEGMDVTTIGIPNNEAQFLETRKFQVTEIARIYRVPPHMLADLDRATFSNIEQQSINFVIYTLMPWLVRHEQAIYRDMLTPEERKTIFAKYIVEGMLRGDALSRYQSYQLAINNTILTPNEIRELEDRNPVEGGDVLFTPLNMIELGKEPPAPAPVPATPKPVRNWSDQSAIKTIEEIIRETEVRAAKASDDRRALMNRNVRLFEDAAARVVTREASAIRKAAKSKLGKRDADSFQTWLEGFYKQLREWFPDYFRAIMLTYAESIMASVAAELDGEPAELNDELRTWVDGYLANYVEVYAVGGEKQLRALLAESEGDEDAETKINARMDGWEETKAGKEGFEQSFEAGNALAIYGYVAGGVSLLQWRARGESCPLCRKMNGKRIKIGGSFFDAGDELTADGVDPLPIIRKIKHGPIHARCDCTVVAG